MFYFILPVSILSFTSLALSDCFDTLQRKTLSTLFSILGYLGVVSSIIFLIAVQNTMNPGGGRFPFLRWACVVLFTLLLIHSTFFAVRESRTADGAKRVITAGIYGIVRHPGFYWFALLLISLMTIYQNIQVIAGGIVLIILNLMLIFIQDKYLFPKIFAEYDDYRQKVPFLIPEVVKRDDK